MLFIRGKLHHLKLTRFSLRKKIVLCYGIIVFIMGIIVFIIVFILGFIPYLVKSLATTADGKKITRYMVHIV